MPEEEYLKLDSLIRYAIESKLILYRDGVSLGHFLKQPMTQEVIHKIANWIYQGILGQFNNDWFLEKAFLKDMYPPFHITVRPNAVYQSVDILLDFP
jgi:hypothetical protein